MRAILGLLNVVALLSFRDAVGQAFGSLAAVWYVVMQAAQFHIMFYVSRTLPNMLAFPLCKSTAATFCVLES